MGRMIKNAVPKTASHAIGIPVGTSSIGPSAPTVGQARWNTTTSRFEYYNGSTWAAIAHEGNVTIVRDQFQGTGAQQTFTMTYAYASGQESQVLVFVNQVYQVPDTAYTFNGSTTISFTTAPSSPSPAGSYNVQLLHNFASTIAA